MALPAELVLVRHGESEGNFANRAAKRGDFERYTPELRERESSHWRLTSRGVEQAQTAGAWIAEHIGLRFDRCYSSYFLRAQETAGHLGLPGAEWFLNPFLHERRLGLLSGVAPEEYVESGAIEKRKTDPLFWRPPGGESTLDVALRFDRVMQTLHREGNDGKAILVNHGDVMSAARIILERLDELAFVDWMRNDDPHSKIHNGQVLHYTRRTDPEDPQSALADSLAYRRSVCPWDMSLSCNEWEPIVRSRYTNAQMVENVEHYPRLVGE